MENNEQVLIQRYKANYHIPDSIPVTAEMVQAHWALEKSLRQKLLQSTPENRRSTFEAAYDQLYSELSWLNEFTDSKANTQEVADASFNHWRQIIGAPPKKIYEIGSGKGELITYLAQHGFHCKATEITKERGEKWSSAQPNLTWGESDGIHLNDFEPANFYDVVISNQVIEHMHPDDLSAHFLGVYTILKPGGQYILATPHRYDGPADVSRVFRCETPQGMHLKEYTYRELAELLTNAGFSGVAAPLRLPKKLRKLSHGRLKPMVSVSYLRYLQGLEIIIGRLPAQEYRRIVAKVAKLALFASNLMIVAKK